MAKPRWNINGAGRVWTKDEAWARFELLPEKLVGADRAVQLGNPQVWRAAVAKLPA
jgi:hypothetical protein